MICSEVRQYIFAFLDNELDSALSLEVQQHIEHCPLCARECSIEDAIRRRLAHRLQRTEDAPVFDEVGLLRRLCWESAVRTAAARRRPRFFRWTAGVALAAALPLALGLFLAHRTDRSQRAALVEALVDDFDHFVSEAKPLQIISTDAKEVCDWLRERTALAVMLPILDPATGGLVGGRKCKINGRPAAFAVYRVGGELVSVVALHESDEALSRMKRVERNGHTHWIDHCRGHTVLACRRGDLIYAVISRLAETSLSPLMPPTEG